MENLTCYAAKCRFCKPGGGCLLVGLEIGIHGQCVNYEERSVEQLRHYLQQRGLSEGEIAAIIQEAQQG